MVISAIAGLAIVLATPSSALEIDLGGSQVDLSEDSEEDSELQPRISTDGEQIEVEVYEQPEPETEVRIEDGGITIEEEQEPAQELIDLSVPVE